MTYCFALRLWSQICVTCRSFSVSVSVPLSCFVGSRCLGLVGWLHTYEMGTLDLLMTDVPDFARVAVVAQRGNSDHSSLSAVISIAHSVPNLCVSRKVFLKHQINWNTVCGAIRELPCHNICLSDNPVEVLNEHLSLLVGRYVPTEVISVRNNMISIGLMINAGMLLASSRRLIFGGPVIALGLTGKSLFAVK